MKEHKYNNTVIQSKGGEHGKRVIEWWKKQGVDVKDFSGSYEGRYYGLIDGKFTSVSASEPNIKIIELPESNPQDLIGRNVKGFKFEGDIIEMRKFVGKVGVIQGYDDLDNTYIVAFGDNEFYYPASLIHEHLVEEVPSGIIDLSNVEGVEMIVSYDGKEWSSVKVVAKIGYFYIDSQGIVWKYTKPIEVKKVTMQEVEELFGCRVEIVKEVSNE